MCKFCQIVGNPRNTSGGCVLCSLFQVPGTLFKYGRDFLQLLVLTEHVPTLIWVKVMSSHVVRPDLVDLQISPEEQRLGTRVEWWSLQNIDPTSTKLESNFSAVCVWSRRRRLSHYAARPRQPEDYRAVSVVRPKQLDLPVYSSVSLSVCIRPDGIRLKGCISCRCCCDGK